MTNPVHEHIVRHKAKWSSGLFVLCITAIFFYWNWSSTPQLIGDSEVYQSLDALFTAFTSRDPKKLASCKQKLESQVERGQIPSSAASRLRSYIDEAEQNRWEEASRGLYDFIRGQRTASTR